MSEAEPLRLLIIDISRRFGGADSRVMQLATRLRGRFDVHLATLAGSETERRFVEAGIPVVSVHTGRRSPLTVLALIRIIRRLNPSIVDAHNIQSQIWGLGAAAWLRVPGRIATFHSVYENSERLGRRFGIYRELTGLCARLSTGVISVSETIDAYLEKLSVPPSKRRVIDNGVDVGDRTLPSQPPFGDPDAPLRIVCVGRLVAVKGQRFLLHAVAQLNPDKLAWTCDFVGDGPDASELENLAAELGISDRVRFLGYREDVPDILSKCDLVCIPSLSEGLPYAILEAALAERPIIASAVGGIKSNFGGTDTIRLVGAGDVDGLKSAIEWIGEHADEATGLGRRARRFVEGRFTVEQMVQQTTEFYVAASALEIPSKVSA